MNFFDRLAKRAGYVRKGLEDQGFNSFNGSTSAQLLAMFKSTHLSVSDAEALKANAGWVFACVDKIADAVAAAELEVYETNNNDEQSRVWSGDLMDLLAQPNPLSTEVELFYLLAAHLELTGSAYWYLGDTKQGKSEPKMLMPMIPSAIEIVPGKFPSLVKSYKYHVDGKVVEYPPYDVLHLRRPNPNSYYRGLGKVAAIFPWIANDFFADEFNSKFFLNGAVIGGFLESTEYQDADTLKSMKMQFEDLYTGVRNAFKTVAMPKGVKYIHNQHNHRDMEYQEGKKFNRDAILAGFGVPKSVLGIVEDVNRANAEASEYVFAKYTILPKLRHIEAALNRFLVPRFGTNLSVKFKDPTPLNRELEMKERQAALNNSPYKTVNEVREEVGLEPLPDGDVLPSGNSVPAVNNTPPQKRVQKLLAPLPFVKRDSATKAASKLAKAITKEIAATVEQNIDVKEVGWQAMVDRAEPYEKRLANVVIAHNNAQRDRVIAALSNSKAYSAKDFDLERLLSRDNEINFMFDLTRPEFDDMTVAEGTFALSTIGIVDAFVIDDATRAAIDRAVTLLATRYTETTIEQLRVKLGEAYAQGMGLQERIDLVRGIYEYANEVRADMVAKTETFRTFNDAARYSWEQSGVVGSLEWYTARDELVCPLCGPLDGTKVPIGTNFFNKGDTVTGADGGSLLLNYSDVPNPPLHVRCRCRILPADFK